MDESEDLHTSEQIYVLPLSQLAFYVNLHRAVIGPSATLTGRWRSDIDLRRMLTGMAADSDGWDPVKLS